MTLWPGTFTVIPRLDVRKCSNLYFLSFSFPSQVLCTIYTTFSWQSPRSFSETSLPSFSRERSTSDRWVLVLRHGPWVVGCPLGQRPCPTFLQWCLVSLLSPFNVSPGPRVLALSRTKIKKRKNLSPWDHDTGALPQRVERGFRS